MGLAQDALNANLRLAGGEAAGAESSLNHLNTYSIMNGWTRSPFPLPCSQLTVHSSLSPLPLGIIAFCRFYTEGQAHEPE
jgi:hypothetical protein